MSCRRGSAPAEFALHAHVTEGQRPVTGRSYAARPASSRPLVGLAVTLLAVLPASMLTAIYVDSALLGTVCGALGFATVAPWADRLF